ncbi:MAG: FAD-dependent oxidoreductase [Deltaproteobacteria bacterium]|nr:FAD-dependent oxidoreductase [Deltaproteobacteria bacterium]
MTQGHRVIIIGAGILGLASAYHLLKSQAGLDLLVVERLAASGRGDTARSAAAFRDMFSSPVNRQLSQGSIAFYESLEKDSHRIGLKKIGYLWLKTAGQMAKWRQALAHMADAGVAFRTLEVKELTARLPELRPIDLSQGIFGLNCGLLDPARLTRFYEQEVLKREFEVGNLYINRGITGARVGVQPFGGFKMSGSNAKAGGPDYVRLFMEMKTVAEKL